MEIYHPNVIQSPIENDDNKVKFNDKNGGVKTELRQKVLLQLYICELHIDTKHMLLGFQWQMTKKDLCIFVILLFDYLLHNNYER